MNALAVCMIAAHFLDVHLTPLNRPVEPCQVDVVVYVASGGGFAVTSPMPRPWRVLIDAHGRVTSWTMQDVHP